MDCKKLSPKALVRAEIFYNEGAQKYGWVPVSKDDTRPGVFIGTVAKLRETIKSLNRPSEPHKLRIRADLDIRKVYWARIDYLGEDIGHCWVQVPENTKGENVFVGTVEQILTEIELLDAQMTELNYKKQ